MMDPRSPSPSSACPQNETRPPANRCEGLTTTCPQGLLFCRKTIRFTRIKELTPARVEIAPKLCRASGRILIGFHALIQTRRWCCRGPATSFERKRRSQRAAGTAAQHPRNLSGFGMRRRRGARFTGSVLEVDSTSVRSGKVSAVLRAFDLNKSRFGQTVS